MLILIISIRTLYITNTYIIKIVLSMYNIVLIEFKYVFICNVFKRIQYIIIQ